MIFSLWLCCWRESKLWKLLKVQLKSGVDCMLMVVVVKLVAFVEWLKDSVVTALCYRSSFYCLSYPLKWLHFCHTIWLFFGFILSVMGHFFMPFSHSLALSYVFWYVILNEYKLSGWVGPSKMQWILPSWFVRAMKNKFPRLSRSAHWYRWTRACDIHLDTRHNQLNALRLCWYVWLVRVTHKEHGDPILFEVCICLFLGPVFGHHFPRWHIFGDQMTVYWLEIPMKFVSVILSCIVCQWQQHVTKFVYLALSGLGGR